MYEIKIKGSKDPIIVPDDVGVKTKAIFSDDKLYPDTQKIGIKDWIGTKGELKSVFHIKEESNAFATSQEIVFSDSDLQIFEKQLIPFMEKRPIPLMDDGSLFDYLTRENEVLFLESVNVLSVEDHTKILEYRITNPQGFFGMRNKISQYYRMKGRQQYEEKKRLEGLDLIEKNIGVLPQ